MTVVAGIDEAGYGPRLGPLVTTCAAFGLADGLGGPGLLWDLLGEAVCRPGRGAAGRLAVGDSKKLYSGGAGLDRLERAVLAFIAASGVRAGTVDEATGLLLSPECVASLRAHPWYDAREELLPLAADRGRTVACAAELRRLCAGRGVAVLPLRSRLLAEGEFNRRVARENSKATVLAGLVAALLRGVRADAGSAALVVYVDRLGGRTDYSGLLGAAYPGACVWEDSRSREVQSYRIEGLAGPTRAEFRVGADEECFPVALASMTSKYLREVYMRRLNGFWRGIDPGVPPTSGYHADAGPFLDAVEAHRGRLGIDRSEMVRCR